MDGRERIKHRNKGGGIVYILVFFFLLLTLFIMISIIKFLMGITHYNDPIPHKYKKELANICKSAIGKDIKDVYITESGGEYKLCVYLPENYDNNARFENAVSLFHKVTEYAAEDTNNPLHDKPITLEISVTKKLDGEGGLILMIMELSNCCTVSDERVFFAEDCVYLSLYASYAARDMDHSKYASYADMIYELSPELVSVKFDGIEQIYEDIENDLPRLQEISYSDSCTFDKIR